MKRDISSDEFEKLSSNGKKRYIAELLIRGSGATPVEAGFSPIAIIMAGVPGAGKTEFLDSLVEGLHREGKYGEFVRVDLDQIVTIYPGYTPKTYAKYRGQGNNVLARCIDVLRNGRYNMMIDGTFSGRSGSSVKNVEKLLEAGYAVLVTYMHDVPETAWHYTKMREIETDRGIDREGFIQSCENISANLKEAIVLFKDNSAFSITLVKQKELRDSNYDIITDQNEIDNIINQGYNIDKLRKTL